MQRLNYLLIIAALVILPGCGTDLPTSGQDIYGRRENDLELLRIGSSLSEIVSDPHRPYLYATDFDRNLLYFISSSSRQIEKSLNIGPRPSDLDITLDGSRLYVALLGGKSIAVVDLDSQTLVDSIPLDFNPGYIATSKPPYIFVTSSIEIAERFSDEGETYQINTETKTADRVIPPIGLLEVDRERNSLYISVHDRLYQYRIDEEGNARYRDQINTEGPITEMHISADGSRLFTISASPLTTPDQLINNGLISGANNTAVNRVEVFNTDGLTKEYELYTGAFPRAITSTKDVIVVAAADSLQNARSAGFALVYNATSLTLIGTHRLVGTPTSCAGIDPDDNTFYVAVDNPYDIRERFAERQDLQLVDLLAAAPAEPRATLSDTRAARPKELVIDLPGGVTMEMVWVEPGAFMMGSLPPVTERMTLEDPEHPVAITSGYYLGKYEITQGEWKAATGEEPWLDRMKGHTLLAPRNPAVHVSWDDTQHLLAKLNEWEGGDVYRLPTEAEWEYACRAGSTTDFAFGNEIGLLADYAWFRDNTLADGRPWAHAVGLKLPNPWGFYDMHGNVWEWVQDWLAFFPQPIKDEELELLIDPQGPSFGTLRVVKSGIFMAGALGQRSAFRTGGFQDVPDGGVGVRILREGPRSE
jgi:formylglycine-generating enzyme required for sulfatase activity